MIKKLAFLFLTLLVLVPFALAMATIHNFDGNVYVGGEPLTGAEVTTWIGGEKRGEFTSQNLGPGYESYYNIDVQGDTSENGLVIIFRVDGDMAEESSKFSLRGNEDDFDLHVSGLAEETTTSTTTSSSTSIISTTTTTTTTTTSTTVLPTTTLETTTTAAMETTSLPRAEQVSVSAREKPVQNTDNILPLIVLFTFTLSLLYIYIRIKK